jgi:tetratricopeptide (TPR) repeat protein
MTDQRRNEINSWIPKPAVSEDIDHVSSDLPAASVVTGTTFDREHVNIQTLLKFARMSYGAQEYEEAKVLLQRYRARSEARYGPNFEERNDVLGMLATTHCRLKEWESAEEIVHMGFDGKDKAIKLLVWCYCEHGKWDNAEKVLCETMLSESVHETDADEILAEVYFAKGDYDKAIRSCDTILRALSDDHVMFYMTLSLLAQIYEAKGDTIEAKLHRDLLPLGIEGFPISKNTNQ